MFATLLALMALATQQAAAAPAPELQVSARSASGAEQPEFAHAVSRALVVTGATVVLATPGGEPCSRCVAIAVVEEARGRYRIEARQKQRFASGVVEVKPDATAFERARAIAVEVRLLARWPALASETAAPEAAAAVPEPQPARPEPARIEHARAEPTKSAPQATRAVHAEPWTAAERPPPAPAEPQPAPPVPASVQVEAPATAAEPAAKPEPAPRPEPGPAAVAVAPADPAWSPKPPPPPTPTPVASVPLPEKGVVGATNVEIDAPGLAVTAPAPATAPSIETKAPAPTRLSKAWPWIPAAAGAASAIVAGGCAIGAKLKYDSLLNRSVPPDQAPGAREDGKMLQTTSLVLAGVAAAALAAGVVGFAQGGAAEPAPKVVVGAGPTASGGFAVGVSGSLP